VVVLTRVARHGPSLLVLALAVWLVWPVPSGMMPMSADHTVHLTRIWDLGRQVSEGHWSDWSSLWFFGYPTGELYPLLGDIVVIAIMAISLGTLAWPSAYAIGFTLVFALQGLAMVRIGRLLGLGSMTGVIAGVLILCDPGAYREGGWIYTVGYGVWPQALATAFTWLGFAELASSSTGEASTRSRVRAAACFGAAVLAHPITLPVLALGLALFVVCMSVRVRGQVREHAIASVFVAVLGCGFAAFWLAPMLAHRPWMASYGWLGPSLAALARAAGRGQFAQNMSVAVGTCIWLGIVVVIVRGNDFARFCVALALACWLFATRDVFWWLRLDRLGDGFTHLQYQRFLVMAKPGLFLAAAVAIAWPMSFVTGAQGLSARLRDRRLRMVTRVFAGIAGVSLSTWLALGTRRVASGHEVGTVQVERNANRPELDAHFARFVAWGRARWDERDSFYRMAVLGPRNSHVLMDAPVYTHTPTYKVGFTPGDNFVHKPEASDPRVLDRLGVRYLVTLGSQAQPGTSETARFGPIRVIDRGPPQLGVATIRRSVEPSASGQAQLDVIEDAADEGLVRVEVGNASADDELVFNVSGYPRWSLTHEGENVEWYEVPAVGTGSHATQAQRRAGALRGGKAHGDDGSEPILVAAPATNGTYVLEYIRWKWYDVLGTAAFVAACVFGTFAVRHEAFGRWVAVRISGMARRMSTFALTTTIMVGLGLLMLRWYAKREAEGERAIGWVQSGRVVELDGFGAGPLKADMLIHPAVVLPRRYSGAAMAVFSPVSLGPTLTGFVALDDDDAKLPREGQHVFRIDARAGAGKPWQPLVDMPIPHRPGKIPLDVAIEASEQPYDVRVTVISEGKATPAMGFDLALGSGSSPASKP